MRLGNRGSSILVFYNFMILFAGKRNLARIVDIFPVESGRGGTRAHRSVGRLYSRMTKYHCVMGECSPIFPVANGRGAMRDKRALTRL